MVTTYVHFTGRRLSFSRFSLAIQTLATAVSLGKEKKVLSLFFLLLLWL